MTNNYGVVRRLTLTDQATLHRAECEGDGWINSGRYLRERVVGKYTGQILADQRQLVIVIRSLFG